METRTLRPELLKEFSKRNKTLRIKTKLKGVLVFKKGQYLNYVNQEVHKL